MRVLIADDEPLARERIRQLLSSESTIEIVAECENGTEAVTAIRRSCPDLVFLDVKMPELDGLGVVEELSGSCRPAIIFVTAYDQFALQAFEANAVDYLIKPFDRERFISALQRARERLQGNPWVQSSQRLAELLTALQMRRSGTNRITVRSHGRIHLVNTGEIDWIRTADNYLELHVGSRSHLIRMTMNTIAERLPQDRFLRISRSVLVNVTRIKEVRPKTHGDCSILLADGTRLSASRAYRRNLVRLLGAA